MMEPRIDCAYDAMVDVGQLVLNPKNPNKHPARQIELLAKIIKHTGWRNPIVVSNRSGFIMEITPNYCDVTIERWQNYTGQKAQRG